LQDPVRFMSERDDDDADSPFLEGTGAEPPEEEPEPADEDDGSPRVTREELRAFLSRPDTLRRAASIIGARVRPDHVGDFVQDAVSDALAARELPRASKLQPWFDRCCRNVIARAYRKHARRAKHEGEMPEAPAVVDEAGEPVEDPGDAVRDIDPRVEPLYLGDDWRTEGWMFRRWMRQEVGSDPRDRETWAIMEELADAEDDEALSYKKLAAKHGMSEAQLYKRIERLRGKYRQRYVKWRSGMLVVLLRWGLTAIVAGVVIAWALWKLLSPAPPPQILRDPDELGPAPSATASDTPFEPSLPTQPQQPATPKPQTPDKPPQ
jgi:DNA-directed RNA polymerase specialized sigma24 family protein